MSPRVRGGIFMAIAGAWSVLGVLTLVAGNWWVGAVDLVAAAVTAGFGYRALNPRHPSGKTPVKPLRAPRPPR